MKKKFFFVLISLVLLFIVSSGFVPDVISTGSNPMIQLDKGTYATLPIGSGGYPQSTNSVSGYTFSQSTSTYTPATGGTLLCAGGCDDSYHTGIALPFTFTFNGIGYTTVSIQQNGWLVMGTQTPSGYSPIATGSYPNVLAPFARDLYGYAAGDTLRYKTLGTTPNRIFVVEWYHWGIYSGGYNELDFQVQLYETSNVIKFAYNPETPQTSITDVQCGLMGATNTDFLTRTTTTSWSATTAGVAASYCYFNTTCYPAAGLTFTWSPPYVPSGNMGYLSSNTLKLNAGAPILPGSINNQMIQIQVADTGVTSPFIINKLRIGLNGTNNPAVDIANAKLWYTRSSTTFATTRQYGSTVSNPSGPYYFTDTATLDPNSTNYFWLTFDISGGAVSGDSCNASCDTIFATSPMGNQVPTVTSPPGANLIDPYCLGTYSYVGLPYGIYVANVTFGSINNTTGCPGTLPYVYSRYTNLSTTVRQNNPYPIIVVDQNTGNPNPVAFGVWIDWNKNYSLLDPGEWYPTTVIPGNTTTVATATINVPSTATLGPTRMRIRANLSTAPTQANICALLSYGEQEDYTVNVASDTNMTYVTSMATQTNLSNIFVPSANTQILGLLVQCDGNISPISASNFSFGTNGSTNPATDITNAKLWYTGSNPNFATTTQVGSTFSSPNGPFTIAGTRSLVSGVNYFWLTYDIPGTATLGDSVDAQCNSFIAGGITRIPTIISPPGKRAITGNVICGTYTIPGATYPTIASAIADLNSKGTVACPTIFNVAANYVEVAANLTITATGTATNTITFQKSGSGANPCIVASVGTGTYDGVVKLYGASYFTFDGIDIRDTSTNTTTTTQMEWGYALLRPDGNRGDQFNTIKNCNITLNKTNTVTYGIYSYYMNTAGTTNTPLSAAGTNSNNSFLNLNISNCYGGYYLYSYGESVYPFNLEDQNNTISTTGGGRSTITNFGGSTVNAYGIYAYYQCNPTLTNTYINSRGGTTQTGYIYGIYNYAYYNNGNSTISGDTISLVDTIGSTGYMYGIYNYAYYGNNNYVTNNVITGCVNYTSSYYTYYIYNYCYGGGSSLMKNNIVTGNKIIGNTFGNSAATTTYTYDYYNYGFASGKNYFYNNLDSGNVVLGTTSYCYYQLYNYGIADTSICNKNRFVNNTLTGTTATASHYGIYDYYYQSYLYHQMDSNVISNNTCPSISSEYYYTVYQYTGSAYTDISSNIISGNVQNGTGVMYGMYINYYTAPPVGSTFNVTNNQITNLQKVTATGTGTIYGISYSNPVNGTVNINNNTISGFTSAAATTMYGLYQSSSPANILNVNNNKVFNFTTGGASTIYGLYNAGTTTTQATVSQDSVYNLTSLGGTIYGFYLTGGNPVNAYKNRIYGLASTTGTSGSVYGIYVSSGTIVNLYNNVVNNLTTPASTLITPAIAGIYLSGGTYLNVYYNTVYLNATSSGTTFGTAALYSSISPTGIDMRNNIFVDNSTPGASGGFAVAYRRSSTGFTNVLTSNNNCFWAGTPAANHLIFYDGVNSDQTLAAYKTRGIPRDNNSVTELPPFINVASTPYDLHINTGTSTQLESGGQTIAAPPINITDDGFGTPRYPNSGYPVGGFTPTAPDIGFHEFGGLRTDASGPFISYTPLGIGGTGNRAFNNVIITDPIGVNTTAGTKPRCYYKRSIDGNVINDNTNGTDGWKYVEANGTTSPFDFTIDYTKLTGGTGVVAGQIVWYFVVAQDLAGTPNFSANQATFTTAPTSVALIAGNAPITNTLTYTIGTGTLSGVIPVGTAQTYTSLTGAAGIFAAINAGTVSGDITISVTSDLVEDGTNQLNALNETGVGSYKVKIVPATTGLKTISGWVSQAMIRLNGVKRVTIDGNNGFGAKYLTFRNKYGTTPTIQFQNETGVDTVKNCTIEGANTNVSSGIIYFSSTTNNAGIGNDSICINSCDIRDRSDSTAFYANGIYSYGTSTTLQTYNNYNSIINCNIYNYYYDAATSYAGIYIYYYSSDWTISGNSFYQTTSRAPVNAINAYDIYIYNSTNWDFKILNNYFGGTAPLCGGTALTYNSAAAYSIYGIYMYISYLSNTPSSIQGNTFANINLTNSYAGSSTFYRSIYISAGYVNIGNLVGNTIGSGTGTGNITLTTNNASTTSYTIAMINHYGIGAIMNNTIGSITFAGSSMGLSDLYAMIYYSNTTYGQIYTISNNLLGSLTTANSIQCTNQGNYHALRGIYCLNGAGTTNYYTNNIVANITSTSIIGSYTTNSYLCSVYGIQHNSASVASPCFFTGNTVRNLTVNSNVALASYALLGIGASGYDFNTVTNNSVYSLYSLGTGAGTPLVGGYLCGGYTGGLCAYNKAYDFKNTGTGASNPYPLLLGINCQSLGTWNIYNNMICLTNGDPSEYKIITPKYDEKFKQVRVENPPINLSANKNNNNLIKNETKELTLTPGVFDETTSKDAKNNSIKSNVKTNPNVGKNGNDNINSTSVCTIAGFFHTNGTYKSPCNYYYNSIYVGGTMPGNSFNSYDFVRNTNSGLVNIQNNIFVNTRSGGGGYHYCIANESSVVEGWPANSSNYNLYIGANSTIGEWGAGNFLTLAQWQAASLGDANTVSNNPTNVPGTTLFRSVITDNLNIDTTQFGAAYVYQKGIGVPGITNDYNGYPRATSGPVCVGAHEFALTKPVGITLLLPTNGSTGNQTPVAMKWSKGLFATSYGIQIATDSLFSNIVITTTSPDTTYSFTGASPLTYYYWRVNPVYPTGAVGPLSTIFNFKVIGTPNTVVLNSPVNGAVNQAINLTLNWFKVVDQTDKLTGKTKKSDSKVNTGTNLMGPNATSNYWFEISTDSTFATGVTVDSTLTDSTKTTTLLNATIYYWHVKAKNQFGWGNFSTRWSFTTIVPLPTAPVLTAPPNGAINVNPAPTLSWNAVQYATSYRIQIASTAQDTVNFTTTTWDTTGVTIAQLTCPTGKLIYNTKYYWRVNATNFAGTGPWASPFNFRTSSDPTALSMSNFVSLICPKFMSSGTATRLPVAIRGTVQGLVPNKTYRYYNLMAISTDVGTTAAGAGILMLINTTTNTFTYSSLGSLTTAGQYETFVANSSGNYTGWFGSLNSGNARFTAGNYVYPTIVLGDSVGTLLARYAMNDSIQVLALSASAGATNGTGVFGISLGLTKNFVQLYDNTAGTGKPLASTWIENQGYTFTASSAAQFYVDSVNLFNGRWGTLLPNTLAGGLQRVEQRSLSGGVLLSFNTNATGIWPSGANTVNPAGGTTPIRLPLYDAPLLNAPVLVSPVSGVLDLTTTPTLTWNISNVAASYRVQIATDTIFGTPAYDTAGLAALTITVPAGKLTTNTKYYWRVNAANALGTSLWQSPWNFTTKPNAPNSPVLLLPVNGAVNQPTTVLCVWRKSIETLFKTKINTTKNNGDGKDEPPTLANYWHEYSTDSNFVSGVIRDSSLTDTTKSITGLTNSTTYYWRVKGKNQTGWGSFSAFFKFTIVPAIPIAPTLLLPVNGATGVSLTPLLDWNDVSGAVSYRIQLTTGADSATFTSPIWDTTGVTVSQVTVPAGKLSQTTKYFWRVNATNPGGTGPYCSPWNFTTTALGLPLNLKVYLEGFWNGTNQVADTIRIYLAASASPHLFVDSQKVVLGTGGTINPTFTRVSTGSYYIVVQHRNHLVTWSALPQSFVAGVPLNYDFTTAATQAFGSNMKQVGSVWVLYGGDPNIDGSIDAIDIGIFIPQFGTQGYLSCDFDGDGDVTAMDVQIISANFGLTSAVPSLIGGPEQPLRKKININDLKDVNKSTQKNNNKRRTDNK